MEGVTYNDGKAYLVVQGVLLDPQSLTAVIDTDQASGSGSADSALTYLGQTVSSDLPIVLVDDGIVSGDALTFTMERSEDAVVKIYDAFDDLVRTISLGSDDTSGGENRLQWDGLGDAGAQVSDGLYYYTVQTGSGFAPTPVSEAGSGIKFMNGTQYLVLDETGRLVSLSSITQVN